MKMLLSLLFLISFLQLNAQDLISTNNGEVRITPVLHGSLILSYNDLTIFVDPYGGAEKFKDFPPADLILITDIHGDHLHKATLKELDITHTTFIVPKAVAEQMDEFQLGKMIVLNNDESTLYQSIEISALPMYNLPESEDSRHTKGRGNGYVLTIGGKKIYISGDTEDIPEMRNLKNIDVAFICMNLPYTMSVEQAADAVLAFNPSIVYPYHFRGKDGLADVEAFKNIVNKNNSSIDIRLRNWYPEN
ncbi:MBL fold metallo-hydrolase [Marivirga sp. S37H4]|uniref:MBL fold metallo-hydrolase n=1 Tax=Marivirga aurantiaca TaxID=2802615 RepID=A0A934X1J6_9BACT|nr:MBL fold metallo-hydrolase [Marivirga aurantiaca]MBK6267288.1 MBL fold metallo-hydrolase [Marivirga aurantiaca]